MATSWKKYLHKNEFFAVTPLSGWSYIYGAKTIKQILIWYILIILFVCLTILNVQQVTSYYLGQPTKFSVRLQSSTKDLFLPNFTLSLTVDILESAGQLPKLLYVPKEHERIYMQFSNHLTFEANQKLVIFHDYLCATSTRFSERGTGFIQLSDQFREALEQTLQTTSMDHIINMDQESKLTNFADQRILENWTKEMESGQKELIEYWRMVTSRTPQKQNRIRIRDELQELHNSVVGKRPNNTIIKMMLLNTMLNKKSDTTISKQASPSFEKLFRNALNDLGNVLHVGMEPSGIALLKGWSYTWNVNTQTFTLSLILPPGLNNLKLDLYSFLSQWHEYVLRASEILINNHLPYSNFFKGETKTLYCNDYDKETMSLSFGDAVQEIRDLWSEYLANSAVILLSFPNGHSTQIHPKTLNSLTLKPSVIITSKTNHCTRQRSIENCFDDCYESESLKQCNCLPWTAETVFFSPEITICGQPCIDHDAIDECNMKCEQDMSTACHLSVWHSSNEGKKLLDGTILSTINLHMAQEGKSFYAELMKEYELTLNGYLALLGGSIEFWCFVDILGLIHLLFFIGMKAIESVWPKISTQANPEESEQLVNERAVQERLNVAIEKIEMKLMKRTGTAKSVALKWLHGNRFFRETPIIGLNMITMSNFSWEVLAWYVIMVLFGIISAVNVYGTIDGFVNRQTHVSFTPTRQLPTSGIPNFTIQMYLPLFWFAPYEPRTPYNMKVEQSQYALYDEAVSHEMDEMYTETVGPIDYSLLVYAVHYQWLEGLRHGTWKELVWLNGHDNQSHTFLSEPRFTDDMYLKVHQNIIAFDDLWENWKQLEWLQVQQLMPKRFTGPLTYDLMKGLFYKLMLLQALGKDVAPGTQLLASSLGNMEKATIVGSPMSMTTGTVLTELNCTLEQLHADTMRHLGHVIAAQLSQGATAAVSDITFDTNSFLMLKFHVQVPQGITELDLMFRSLPVFWFWELAQFIGDIKDNIDDGPVIQFGRFVLNLQLLDSDSLGFSPMTYWEYSRDNTDVLLKFPGDQSLLLKFPVVGDELFQYDIRTKLHHSIQTPECEPESFEWCIEDCLLNSYIAKCNCIPWQMQHRNPILKLCNPICENVHRSQCYSSCREKKYCSRQELLLIQIPQQQGQQHTDPSVFAQARLKLHASFHIKLTESYKGSIGNLLAEIGSLLDFWLGLNVIAAVHFMLYVLLALDKFYRRRGRSYDKDAQLKRLDEIRMQLDIVQGSVKSEMDKLLQIKLAQLKTNQDQSNYKWLRQNKFYDQTPITGFSFISSAKVWLEAVFWWSMIMFFLVVTVVNVASALDSYSQRPTTVAVNFDHSSQLQFGNFTIAFRWPLLEFIDHIPTRLDGYPLDILPEHTMDRQLICYLMSSPDWWHVESPILWDMLLRWSNKEEKWNHINIVKNSSSQFSLFSAATLENWHSTFQNAVDDLLSFLDDQHVAYNKARKNSDDIEARFAELVDKPLQRGSDLLMLFFTLEAVKNGQSPWKTFEKNFKKMLDQHGKLSLDCGNDFTLSTQELLNNVTVLEVYKAAEQALSQMIHINIVDEPLAKVQLKDWSYGWSERHAGLADKLLTFYVSVPINESRTKLSFELRSYVHMWYQYLFDAFDIHTLKIDHKRKTRFQQICQAEQYGEYARIQQHAKETEFKWMNELEDHLLHFETDSLQKDVISRGDVNHLLIQPMFGLNLTAIKGCSMVPLDQCVDECLATASKSTCGCVPWTLLYRKHEESICMGPCNMDSQRTECLQKCDLPCTTQLYGVKEHTVRWVELFTEKGILFEFTW